jgi:hypothetical protein
VIENRCQSALCRRQKEEGYSVCSRCLTRLLRDAFGPARTEPEPQSWHDRARAHRGRVQIVGGIAA